MLAEALIAADFKRRQVILREAALASEAHILLRGIARISCQSGGGERITIALLAPGPIPEVPSLLSACFSHQDIADLVGASRPRVTEHLAQLEHERLIIRQGRQLIVRVDEIGLLPKSADN